MHQLSVRFPSRLRANESKPARVELFQAGAASPFPGTRGPCNRPGCSTPSCNRRDRTKSRAGCGSPPNSGQRARVERRLQRPPSTEPPTALSQDSGMLDYLCISTLFRVLPPEKKRNVGFRKLSSMENSYIIHHERHPSPEDEHPVSDECSAVKRPRQRRDTTDYWLAPSHCICRRENVKGKEQ